MSLNQLTLDKEKNWLDIRVNSIKIDETIGEETELTLNLTGAITDTANCKIVKYGSLVTVRIDEFNQSTTSQDYIYAANYPSEFIPTNKTSIVSIVVIDNASNSPGAIDFNVASGIRFQALLNAPSFFTNGATAGVPGPISFSYYLE